MVKKISKLNTRFIDMSLRNQFLLTIVVAAAIAALVIVFSHVATKGFIERYFDDNQHWMELADIKAKDLQQYIIDNGLSTDDWEALEKWDKTNAGVYIYIYDPGRKIYESPQSIVAYGYEEYRQIRFSDETADLSIFYAIDAIYYNLATLIEICLGVIVFFIIVMKFVRYLLDSIRKLENDVKILEGGGLTHQIDISAGGEIGSLERSIDEMRISLKANMEREEEVRRANNELVTRMAHDLRTPLTSLLLYMDLLDNRKYKNEEEMGAYIRTAREKAERIKTMSDQLFERFLITGDRSEVPDPPELVRYVFEDPLSSLIMILTDQGFAVESEIEWPDISITVMTNYILRILDNAYSNIIKYADKAEPVIIGLDTEGEMVCLRITNHIGDREHSEGGSNIGLDNIELMMGKMSGQSEVSDDGEIFSLCLRFPACSRSA